jgi:oligopeptidase A
MLDNHDLESPYLNLSHPIPFDQFTDRDIISNVDILLKRAHDHLKAIENTSVINYHSILGALDKLGEHLESCITTYSQLESLLGTQALRDAMQVVQPRVSAFYATIPFSEALYQKIKQVAESDEVNSLTLPQKRYLEQTLLSFQRNGAEVDKETKVRLEAIERSLAELTMTFAKHVVEETDAFEWLTTDVTQLEGLPPSAIASAAQSAQSKNQEGWRFTLQGPSFRSIITYCDDRSVREHFYRAYVTRATDEDKNNQSLIHQILNLRQEKAKLLGYQNVSDLFLASRMVKNGTAAQRFVDELIERTIQFSTNEQESLHAFAVTELQFNHPLQAWDIAYVAEKQKRITCGFEAEELKPYFEVRSVMKGMFQIVERLYQVEVVPIEDISSWHSDVMTFEIKERGDTIGVFYADLFPREGKQGGAWMCPLLYHTDLQPHVGLICANFTPPIDGRSLITHREVETLFHEFGHLLHHLLTQADIRSQAGTNVAWDFVELPSQIMENWCWERKALDIFAKHHTSGESLPDALYQKLKNTQTFRSASAQMRQLSFAEIDLKLHRQYDHSKDGDVLKYAREEMEKRSPTALTEDYAMIAGFTHLFASPTGYAAGYYSYKWAEVLDADAFTRFKTEGLFSPQVGSEFRTRILGQGDSVDPAQLFEHFMGRPPSSDALFERLNLKQADT